MAQYHRSLKDVQKEHRLGWQSYRDVYKYYYLVSVTLRFIFLFKFDCLSILFDSLSVW
jgi:hypothetical protein